ncbi:MAG: DUF1761 domain-containing protein [Micavibrio aeruginosavorus]|uniref:DUF1761 domain-containing protein n=1 Tax=Micavibrio aeruginosavorus TaxID=349221 RepID=A0A7T5R245_9BACT|nr:MAG: DUF1761 domain-containing protein [Micavibrio aeruginosavorus]
MNVIEAVDFPYTATLASAIGAFALGLLWYHPKVMGRRWMELRGLTADDIKVKPLQYVSTLLLWFLAAAFFSFFVDMLNISKVHEFISLACLLWVAFSMPPTVMGSLYTGVSFEAIAIDMAYQLGGYYVFAMVHIATAYIPVMLGTAANVL